MSSIRHYPTASANASLLAQARIGASVGFCGAAGINLHRHRQQQIDAGQAIAASLKAGLISGLVTAAAGLAAGQFRSTSLATLAGLATGTALMYAYHANLQETSDA